MTARERSTAPAPAVRAAAALVLKGEEPPADLTGAVLDLLKLNKVHVEALAGSPFPEVARGWAALEARPEAAAVLQEEAALRSELLDAWRRVDRAFVAEGIEGVLFKSPRWFPARSSNLDVLVPPPRFREAARILSGLGHIRFPHYREDHKLLFRTFLGGRPSLSVHLHEMVSWGKVPILDGAAVAGRAVAPGPEGLRVSAPADALAVTVAHTVFETDQIRLGDLMTAREAIRGGASPEALLDEARRGSWEAAAAAGLKLYDFAARHAGGCTILEGGSAAAVEAVLASSPWAARRAGEIMARGAATLPLALPRRFSKEHLVRYLMGDRRRAPDEKVADLAAAAWNLVANRLKLRARPGSLVTVGGIDGAGKSEAAGAVAGALELCEVPLARVWTRGGFTRLAAAGKAAIRRAAPASVPPPADEERKLAFLERRWARRLWIWTTVLEQAVSVQRVRLHLALGRTVVADRYVADTLADLLARIPAPAGGPPPQDELARAASLLLGVAPRPRLRLLIDLPASVAFQRKADGGSLPARERLAAAQRALAAAGPAVTVDGLLPREAVAQEMVERALRTVFARFPGGTP